MSRRPVERTLDAQLFNRRISFEYSETWIAWSVLGLRLIMAWVFLQAGLQKLAEEGWTNPGAWSAEGFLIHAVHEDNPFAGLLESFAEFLWLLDPMVMWGQIAIGLALLIGAFFRLAAMLGAIQMFFFWIAAFEGGVGAGLPIAHGYVVDYTFVYMLILFALGAVGAGRILGVDEYLEGLDIVQRNPWLMYLLG